MQRIAEVQGGGAADHTLARNQAAKNKWDFPESDCSGLGTRVKNKYGQAG
jgi:hypothetical protein